MEVWKDILEYKGLYQVSDLGKVRNRHGKLLKFRVTKKVPYARVGLSIGNTQTKYSVHRLVLSTFSPHLRADEMTVDHINGNKLDNSLSNLRWMTNSNNSAIKRSISFISDSEILVYEPETQRTRIFREIV